MLFVVLGAVIGMAAVLWACRRDLDDGAGCLFALFISVLAMFIGSLVGLAAGSGTAHFLPTHPVVMETHTLVAFPDSTGGHPVYLQLRDGKAWFLTNTPGVARPETLDSTDHVTIQQSTDSSAQVIEFKLQFDEGWFALIGISDSSTHYRFELPPDSFVMCNGSPTPVATAACTGS